MRIGRSGGLTPARRPHQQPFLDQIRLVDLFQRTGILTDGRGNGRCPDGASIELVDQRREDAVVHLVQPLAINIQSVQGKLRNLLINGSVTLDLREVSDSAQERVRDPGRTSGARRNLIRRGVLDGHVQDASASLNDVGEGLGVVVLQPKVDAETRAQRRCQQPGARRSADKGKRVEFDLDCAGIRACVDNQVDSVVLHCAVQVLLHDRRKSVDFIDEQHVIRLEVGQQSREVTGLVKDGSGSGSDGNAQFVGDDVGQSRLAQPGRSVQQRVIQGLAAIRSRLDKNPEVFERRALSREVIETRGPQHAVQFTI